MSDEVRPINHSGGSAAVTTAYEAGKGGLFGFVKGALAIPVVGGFIAGIPTFLLGLGGAVGAFTTTAGAVTTFTPLAGLAALGGLAGWSLLAGLGGAVVLTGISFALPIVGVTVMSWATGIGTVLGLAKGTSRGMNKVGQEQAAAEMLRAEVAMAQNGVPVQASGYPPQGSRMNPARSGIELNGLQRDGVLAPEAALQRG